MVVAVVAVAALAALVTWVARNSYWEDMPLPMPLRGEALWNPNYAAQRFAESLGARTVRQRVLGEMPAPQDVLILGAWHWDLIDSRRARLERWVESGGRLIVDRSLIGSVGTFSRWSGIDRLEADEYEADDPDPAAQEEEEYEDCRKLQPQALELCGFRDRSHLVPMRRASWSLHDDAGVQIARVAVGRGSVTVINAQPFVYRQFLEGDHPRLFVAVTQLSRGDRVHFLAEEDHPNLLMLLWLYAAPALCLGLGWVALALWRNGVRLGPPIPPEQTARRSLSEQIRGTGQFVLRFGSGAALHQAQLRALNEAAARRIAGYSALAHAERSHEVARLAGLDVGALTAAIGFTGKLRSSQFRSAMTLLETARRRISEHQKGL